MSIIIFSQDFKAACDACIIHENATVWFSEHYLSGPVQFVIKTRVALPTETALAREGCLKLYSAIANYLLKQYAAVDNIAVLDGDSCTFKKNDRGRPTTPTNYGRKR